MSRAKEYLDKYANTGSIKGFEMLRRALSYGTQFADDGLNEKRITPAARIECLIYYKTYLVIKDIGNFIAVLVNSDEVKSGTVPLPAREIALADECPAYLDVFEEYLKMFGDVWFDEPFHRTQFFNDILSAFRWICSYLLIFAEIDLAKEPKKRLTYTFLLRDLKGTALIDSADERRVFIPVLLENYASVKPVLCRALEILRTREKELLAEESEIQGLNRVRPFREMLAEHAKWVREHEEILHKMPGDKRPVHVPCDDRYDRIANRMWIWSAMPPSVTHFVQGCHLLEEAALLASQKTPDYNFSSRDFVAKLLGSITEHPKFSNASRYAEAQFTDEERDDMSVAFKGLCDALMRLRDRLRSSVGFGEADIDEYDDFIKNIPVVFGPEPRDCKNLLFGGNDGFREGFNSELLLQLSEGASKLIYPTPYSVELKKAVDVVNASLIRAFASGRKDVIESAYDKVVEKYFVAEKKAEQPKSTGFVTLMSVVEDGLSKTIAEPGPNDKVSGRFSISPKTRRIVDLQHRTAPYYLEAYEDMTASKPVGYINRLITAIGRGAGQNGDRYGGWERLDKKWRMAFKDGVYRRFKDDQIQIGTRANAHLGECRIIPDNLFDELTKAVKSTSEIEE